MVYWKIIHSRDVARISNKGRWQLTSSSRSDPVGVVLVANARFHVDVYLSCVPANMNRRGAVRDVVFVVQQVWHVLTNVERDSLGVASTNRGCRNSDGEIASAKMVKKDIFCIGSSSNGSLAKMYTPIQCCLLLGM